MPYLKLGPVASEDIPFWTPEELAQRLDVSVVTARRWKRTGRVPHWARKMIRLVFGGELGLIDPAWRLWRLGNGQLTGPDGWSFTSGEVLSIPLLYARAQAYQDKLKFSTQADWIEQKYVRPEQMRAGDRAEEFRLRTARDFRPITSPSPRSPPDHGKTAVPGIAPVRRARAR